MDKEYLKIMRDVRNIATIQFSILRSDPKKRAYFINIFDKLSGKSEKFYISSNEVGEYEGYLKVIEKERDNFRKIEREKRKQREQDLEKDIDIEKASKIEIEDIGEELEEELDEDVKE